MRANAERMAGYGRRNRQRGRAEFNRKGGTVVVTKKYNRGKINRHPKP